VENIRERDHFHNVVIEERIILKIHLQEVGLGWDGKLIVLPQDGDRWRALVNVIITFGFQKNPRAC
jgi:hypothetical protein